MKRNLLLPMTALVASPALAQGEPPPVDVEVTSGGVNSATSIAVPAMPTEGGVELALGRNISGVIASGLRASSARRGCWPR